MSFTPEFEGNAEPNPEKTIVNQRTVWNFYNFTYLGIESCSWIGTIIAPLAELHFTSANIEGNIYVESWGSGNGESHSFPPVPNTEMSQCVCPEPSPMPTLVPTPCPILDGFDCCNLWPAYVETTSTTFTNSFGYTVFTGDQLSLLVSLEEWEKGVTWTLRLSASSTCSHDLDFAFIRGGGQLPFTVPANASNVTIATVDELFSSSSTYLRAYSDCTDDAAATITFSNIEIGVGNCLSSPSPAPTPCAISEDFLCCNLWKPTVGIARTTFTNVVAYKVFTAAQLSSLFALDEWDAGFSWTLRLSASSTCRSNDLEFAFSRGGGQLRIIVPANATNVTVAAVDVLDSNPKLSFFRAYSTCTDDAAATVTLSDIEIGVGDCLSPPTQAPSASPSIGMFQMFVYDMYMPLNDSAFALLSPLSANGITKPASIVGSFFVAFFYAHEQSDHPATASADRAAVAFTDSIAVEEPFYSAHALAVSLAVSRAIVVPIHFAHARADACTNSTTNAGAHARANLSTISKTDADAIAGSFSRANAYAEFHSNNPAVTGAFSVANTGSYSSPLSTTHTNVHTCADATPFPRADFDAIAGSLPYTYTCSIACTISNTQTFADINPDINPVFNPVSNAITDAFPSSHPSAVTISDDHAITSSDFQSLPEPDKLAHRFKRMLSTIREALCSLLRRRG